VFVWSVNEQQCKRVLSLKFPEQIIQLAWANHSLRLAVATPSDVKIQDLNNLEAELTTLRNRDEPHVKGVTRLAFSPDDTTCLLVQPHGFVTLVDANNGEYLWTMPTYQGIEITAVAFSPNGLIVASGEKNGDVRLWNAKSGEALEGTILGKLPSMARQLLWSEDGNYLLSSSESGVMQVWNVPLRKDVTPPDSPTGIAAFGWDKDATIAPGNIPIALWKTVDEKGILALRGRWLWLDGEERFRPIEIGWWGGGVLRTGKPSWESEIAINNRRLSGTETGNAKEPFEAYRTRFPVK